MHFIMCTVRQQLSRLLKTKNTSGETFNMKPGNEKVYKTVMRKIKRRGKLEHLGLNRNIILKRI
jgi:hypothetical protein